MNENSLSLLQAALIERCADCHGNEDYHACSLVTMRRADEA